VEEVVVVVTVVVVERVVAGGLVSSTMGAAARSCAGARPGRATSSKTSIDKAERMAFS